MDFPSVAVWIVVGFVVVVLPTMVKVFSEWERGVVLRLGKYVDTRGPGVVLLLPLLDRAVRVDLREVVMDIPSQEAITRDNVTLKVNAVLFFRVVDPQLAVIKVEYYHLAVSQISQTTLRSIIGQSELDELLANREKVNQELQRIIDQETERWGLKVTAVELKDLELPPSMQRAMARQAEAEREKRAKVIHAEGEFQAAQRLADAGRVISAPAAMQLRYLQTLTEISVDKSSTILFPVPIDTFRQFLPNGSHREESAPAAPPHEPEARSSSTT